jgi:hypothetical protein
VGYRQEGVGGVGCGYLKGKVEVKRVLCRVGLQ